MNLMKGLLNHETMVYFALLGLDEIPCMAWVEPLPLELQTSSSFFGEGWEDKVPAEKWLEA